MIVVRMITGALFGAELDYWTYIRGWIIGYGILNALYLLYKAGENW